MGGRLLHGHLLARLDPRRFCVSTQESSAFSFSELLGLVLEELDGLPSEGQTKFARVERLKKIVAKVHQEGRHLVLIFDEAQDMTPATLNELKLLTNLNRAGQSYLTIILVGQPELRPLVSGLPQIDQRISLRFHLNALDLEDSTNYLRHRLKVAGHPTGELFTPDAIERAYQMTLGVPRELNRVAKLSLEFAWVKEYPQVNLKAVEAVVRDLERHQNLPRA